MRDRPALAETDLARHLAVVWGVDATTIEFLPVGNDSRSFAYQVRTQAGARRFLKVRAGPANPAAVVIPEHLVERGLRWVIPPVPTVSGELWSDIDGYRLVLYPFVDGQMALGSGLTDRQWVEYGAFLRALQHTDVPPRLAAVVSRETFVPRGADLLRELTERLRLAGRRPGRVDGAAQHELARLWGERAEQIDHILTRAEELGVQARARQYPYRLCHGDIHLANILVGADEDIVVVDWDDAVLAPVERDLVFVLNPGLGGCAIDSREHGLFRRGYGDHRIDMTTLAYYRYEWVVADLGAYAEQALLMDASETARQAAVDGIRALFAPAGTVDLAQHTV